MTIKVYIVGRGMQYAAMFQRQEGFEVVDDPEKADMLQFTGGEDVTPALYGEATHPRTYCSPPRDREEAEIYNKYVGLKSMLGICRGAQFLNVMNGGQLYQDVDNHAIGGTHPLYSERLDMSIDVTSTHHQMMRPNQTGLVEAFAWKLARTKQHMIDRNRICTVLDDPHDAEVVYYEGSDSLCFQPHPEYPGANSTREYYFNCIEHYFN